ncbi:MAG TPA: methyl-accepting chemotaxis protein, partial [Burkholderiaceae bacterium]
VHDRATKFRATLTTLSTIPGQQALATRIATEFTNYLTPALQSAAIMLGKEQGDPQAHIAAMQSALKTLEADLQTTNTKNSQQFDATLKASTENVTTIITVTLAVAILVIAALMLASWLVIRMVWRQLGGEPEYAARIARTIADGDFSLPVNLAAGDRTSLLAALRDMQQKLAETVANIQQAGASIAAGSREIAEGNADLSRRTETQAASLEQTAAAMEQMTKTVRQNADNASQANALVASASEVAISGGDIVEQAVKKMHAISDSSRRIVDIIGVIDGIAFQTNILALNAAVEAARAGEQGRGFAVVATEVRSLAQRSAAAAREIKGLIAASVEDVEGGGKLVDHAGSTMRDIVASVTRVTDLMSEIALATREQSDGINDINQAVVRMDDMTQQNAALVEQAASAAKSMQDEAARLAQTVAVFRLSSSRPAAGQQAEPQAASVTPLRAKHAAKPRRVLR